MAGVRRKRVATLGALPLLATLGIVVASRAAAEGAALDLHAVAWANVTLPGAACGASQPIALDEGTGSVTPIPRRWASDHFYGKRAVTVNTDPNAVVYGDLEGNGTDDAALWVNCNNGGGTADGALLYDWVVFSGSSGRLSVVGVITPRVQPAGQLPTVLQVAIKPGKVVARESFYGRYDPTCCSSGRATTTWTYVHRTLSPGKPHITHRASTSLP
jgi:hypothetical protein